MTLVSGAERVDRLLEVLGGGVQLLVDLCLDTVLFTTDDADLNLEDDFCLDSSTQQFSGNGQVLVDRHRGAVPHVRLEQRSLAGVDTLLRDGQQRAHVGVQLVLGAVVGVQCDGDVVLGGHDMRELGERHGTGHHVLDTQTRAELGSTGGELMMPSLPASANPLMAALMVSEDVQLMAGKAKECSLARFSISV